MLGDLPTYGENLSRMRAGRRQKELAAASGKSGQANLPSYENNHRPPTPELVRTHAEMMQCSTKDLMLGVVMDFDRVRFPDLTDPQLEGLLGGIAVMEKKQRATLAETGAKALAQFLSREESQRALQSKTGTRATASGTHRGRKQA